MRIILTAFYILIISLSVAGQSNDHKFSEKESILILGGDTLFGTTTVLKKNVKPRAHALIHAGSGPTDRNGNNGEMTNNSLQKLAHALAMRGIESTRIDKRAIAQSKNAALEKPEMMTIEVYMDDAAAWLEKIKKENNGVKTFVIGHSEGSLIGMVAAMKTNAAGFISLAGPGQSVDLGLKEQLKHLASEPREVAYEILDSLKAGYLVSSVPPAFMSLFSPQLQPYLISWMRYNPAAEIKKYKGHVMIVQGTSDLQVREEDAEMLRDGRPDASFLMIDDMNHVLVIISGDRDANIGTYNDPDLPLPELLSDGIADFIKKAASQ